jgi:hypothetical protein
MSETQQKFCVTAVTNGAAPMALSDYRMNVAAPKANCRAKSTTPASRMAANTPRVRVWQRASAAGATFLQAAAQDASALVQANNEMPRELARDARE